MTAVGPQVIQSAAEWATSASLEDLKNAAAAGDVKAQVRLGKRHFRAARDAHNEAAHWFRKAADGGDPNGAYMLARCYDLGVGVAADAHEALVWFSKASELGSRAADLSLWLSYRQGRGVAKDPGRAMEAVRRAAERGCVLSQKILASAYALGKDVPKDFAQAERYYGLAAAQGDADARNALRALPLDRHPVLRHRQRILVAVGYLFFGRYALTTHFSFAWLRVLVFVGLDLAVGAAVGVLLTFFGGKRMDRDVGDMSARLRLDVGQGKTVKSLLRRSLRILLIVPAEDGAFLVPLIWLGVHPVAVAISAALFALVHYPKFTWRFCISKALYIVAVALWVLPYGIWSATACHLLIDFMALGLLALTEALVPRTNAA